MKLIMRPPSEALRRALSSHPLGDQIDPDAALAQHTFFAEQIRAAGGDVVLLPPDPVLPDACFTQDVVITFPLAAEPAGRAALIVACRPGAPSRRPEVDSVLAAARELAPAGCPMLRIEEPGTMDGGDVLIFGDRVVIGLSGRTNGAGARQLEAALKKLGYRVWLCPVTNQRLHFASAITVVRPTRFIGVQVGYDDLDAVSPEILPEDEIDRIVIPDDELPAHNVLPVGDTIFIPAGNPVAVRLLREAGERVVEIPFEHITRADAGMTCLVCRVY